MLKFLSEVIRSASGRKSLAFEELGLLFQQNREILAQICELAFLFLLLIHKDQMFFIIDNFVG